MPGFGTGLHETTQMCLAALAERHRCGSCLDRVLAYGSGSGILGIAAAVLDAGQVDAIEIDTNVHGALRENARRNGVVKGDRSRISFFHSFPNQGAISRKAAGSQIDCTDKSISNCFQ